MSVVAPPLTDELAERATGALIIGFSSSWDTLADPVVATPIFDGSEYDGVPTQPEPPIGDQTFPAKPVRLNTYRAPDGERQSLVLATGQYRSSSQVQRLDDEHRRARLLRSARRDRRHPADDPHRHVDDHGRPPDRDRLGHRRGARQQQPGVRAGGGRSDAGRGTEGLARFRSHPLGWNAVVRFDPAFGGHDRDRVPRAGEGRCRQRRLRHEQGDELRDRHHGDRAARSHAESRRDAEPGQLRSGVGLVSGAGAGRRRLPRRPGAVQRRWFAAGTRTGRG